MSARPLGGAGAPGDDLASRFERLSLNQALDGTKAALERVPEKPESLLTADEIDLSSIQKAQELARACNDFVTTCVRHIEQLGEDGQPDTVLQLLKRLPATTPNIEHVRARCFERLFVAGRFDIVQKELVTLPPQVCVAARMRCIKALIAQNEADKASPLYVPYLFDQFRRIVYGYIRADQAVQALPYVSIMPRGMEKDTLSKDLGIALVCGKTFNSVAALLPGMEEGEWKSFLHKMYQRDLAASWGLDKALTEIVKVGHNQAEQYIRAVVPQLIAQKRIPEAYALLTNPDIKWDTDNLLVDCVTAYLAEGVEHVKRAREIADKLQNSNLRKEAHSRCDERQQVAPAAQPGIVRTMLSWAGY